MTDELRNRLRRLDPMASDVPTEPVTTESSRQLLEEIMSTPSVEQPGSSGTQNKRPWLVSGGGGRGSHRCHRRRGTLQSGEPTPRIERGW